MGLSATIPSQFIPCPPLDFPLRLNAETGRFGAARIKDNAPPVMFSDHFASVDQFGTPGIHQIHEAVDLASTEDAPVYAIYSGEVLSVGNHDVVVSHQGVGLAYASQYVHVNPLPNLQAGQRVVKGEPIAQVHVNRPDYDHLHLELWHWVDDTPGSNLDNNGIPLDPTRLLYFWERIHRLDWATLGQISDSVITALNNAVPDPALLSWFTTEGHGIPDNAAIQVLDEDTTWRITGTGVSYLLRAEKGMVTVFDEAYGSHTVGPTTISRVGMVQRWGYPTYMVEANGQVYGLPLHDVAHDAVLGRGHDEARLIDLIVLAFENTTSVELDVRRSAFWHMDGSLDEFAAVIEGVRLG